MAPVGLEVTACPGLEQPMGVLEVPDLQLKHPHSTRYLGLPKEGVGKMVGKRGGKTKGTINGPVIFNQTRMHREKTIPNPASMVRTHDVLIEAKPRLVRSGP